MNLRIAATTCALLMLSLACGTLQVSVEGTPGLDAVVAGTVGALQTQNADFATRAAASTSTPVIIVVTPAATLAGGSIPTPTPSSMPATRITFLSGATVGIVSAPIGAGQTQDYVLDVFQAQPMSIGVRSAGNDVTASVKYEDGTTLLPASAHRTYWSGHLPKTGDYYLGIHGGATPENFTLMVTIPLPVHFESGSDSLTIPGKTVAGYDVSYAVYATKGQHMKINIEQISSKGSLAVYGFQDGESYLRADAGQKSLDLTLPATQDYIISVVPFNGLVLDYIVTITIR